MSIKLSIIIPAYNEQETIFNVVEEIKKTLTTELYEIIVINDGSTDATKKEIEKSADITIINNIERLGYGAALKKGIRGARGDKIIIIDADDTYPVEYIEKILVEMENCDMVVAARGKGKKKYNEGLLRKLVKGILTRFANYLVERKIPDLNSGMRAFNKEDVMKYYHLLPNGFSFTTTLTLAMLSDSKQVTYIDIPYEGRKKLSKFRPVADTINMITLIFRAAVYFNPMRVFLPMSLALVLLGFIVLGVSIVVEGKAWDITIISIFVAAIQIFALGLIADLIGKQGKP